MDSEEALTPFVMGTFIGAVLVTAAFAERRDRCIAAATAGLIEGQPVEVEKLKKTVSIAEGGPVRLQCSRPSFHHRSCWFLFAS